MDEKYKYAPTIFYGVCLFALISNALMAGLADRLTKWRGEKWVKEIEYVYLTLGSLGLFGSINRMDKMVDRLAPEYDLLGPLVLMSAIVLDTSRLAQKLASGTS